MIEILIELNRPTTQVHSYVLPIHPRDLDPPQLAWHLQQQLYDGLHDDVVERFHRIPQDPAVPAGTLPARPTPGKRGERS